MTPVQPSWDTLPKEVKALIISFIYEGPSLEAALKKLKALRVVNKKFKALIDSPATIEAFTRNYIKAHPEELFLVATIGSLERAKFLLEKGANSNVKVHYGETPLHGAIVSGNIDMVKLLLQNKADINAQNEGGETPLYRAIELDQFALVNLLLAAGADPNIKDKTGNSALHVAAIKSIAKPAYSQMPAFTQMLEKLKNAGLRSLLQGIIKQSGNK